MRNCLVFTQIVEDCAKQGVVFIQGQTCAIGHVGRAV